MNKLTFKTRKAFLVAGLLSSAALSSIVFSAPAQAACGGGTLSMLDNSTLTCGDKAYTFASGAFSSFLGTDVYVINVDSFQTHNFTIISSAGGYSPGTYNLNFSVATTGVDTIKAYGTDLQAPLGGSASYSMTGSPAGVPPTAMTNLAGMRNLSIYPGAGVTAAAFTSTLQVDPSTSVTSFTSAILQRSPGTSVPGPLPLLGAGAAFGFSRRIRNRIKVAA
jgi:hypothetical protein